MSVRQELVEEFLSLGGWHFGCGRACTRRAVCEFLAEISRDQFSKLTRRPAVLVIAPARHQVVSSVSYDLDRAGDPSTYTRMSGSLQVVYFSPAMEQLRDSEVRPIVFDALTRAFAVVDGPDEKMAVQLASAAGDRSTGWEKGRRKSAA
jgi:hypothetical protein